MVNHLQRGVVSFTTLLFIVVIYITVANVFHSFYLLIYRACLLVCLINSVIIGGRQNFFEDKKGFGFHCVTIMPMPFSFFLLIYHIYST